MSWRVAASPVVLAVHELGRELQHVFAQRNLGDIGRASGKVFLNGRGQKLLNGLRSRRETGGRCCHEQKCQDSNLHGVPFLTLHCDSDPQAAGSSAGARDW